ncbi:MAG: HTH-type transcriptional repressor FabR [Gammaproteobacteria bacterium]|nr:HTH-type transcriptional repressor FabR [Gammaproteobacteria bacterium]MBT8150119.1 HTH-type transcriptional repressor FabR [Gammaproteobacteria bacterium]NND39640.1 HTH-type transcriptional repressor FabR [Pseudomonadales bacterium]NNM11880.1 HTH-type transcriptional repressor FabR [Pseudomonadales bacterium]RZV57775.1 MAG: HTH-type transcriptional repressor FabR [Pseudomonadales bacterium]
MAKKLTASGLAKTAKTSRKPSISSQELMDAAVRLLDSQRSVSSLSLREIAREAGIAPNSFYRHFRDVDDLAVALIDQAGRSLRGIIREARSRLDSGEGGVRASVEVFMEQLDSEEQTLQILLREMSIGSPAFRKAVDRELQYFEDELRDELVRRAEENKAPIYKPHLAAKAITRLVFTLGASAMELSAEDRETLTDDTIDMVRMILTGATAMTEM